MQWISTMSNTSIYSMNILLYAFQMLEFGDLRIIYSD